VHSHWELWPGKTNAINTSLMDSVTEIGIQLDREWFGIGIDR